MSGRAVFMLLLSLLAVFVVWMAVEPHDRADWMLENALVLLAVVALIVTRRWFVFSNQAYLLIFAFLALHELGSHYT